jgi:hypothetical protein
VLKPQLREGYWRVELNDARAGLRLARGVAQLVLLAFVGPRPVDATDVRHLDGDRMNNSLENLAWGTRAQNEDDKRRHGRDNAGERHGMHKLTDQQVQEMLQRYRDGESPSSLAREFGVNRHYLFNVATRKKTNRP